MKTPKSSPFVLPDFIVLEIVRRKIRHGEEPDNPSLLSQMFDLDEKTACPSAMDKRLKFLNQFWLLFNAIQDPTNPSHWRELCLNNIHRPMNQLNRLATCDFSEWQVRDLARRVSCLPEIY